MSVSSEKLKSALAGVDNAKVDSNKEFLQSYGGFTRDGRRKVKGSSIPANVELTICGVGKVENDSVTYWGVTLKKNDGTIISSKPSLASLFRAPDSLRGISLEGKHHRYKFGTEEDDTDFEPYIELDAEARKNAKWGLSEFLGNDFTALLLATKENPEILNGLTFKFAGKGCRDINVDKPKTDTAVYQLYYNGKWN